MRRKLLAVMVTAAAMTIGALATPAQASAETSGLAATSVQGFKNYAQGQCIGPRWFNVNRYANLYGCKPSDPAFQQQWIFEGTTLWNTRIRLSGEEAPRCLTHLSAAEFHVLLAPCNANSDNQRWNHFGYDGTYFMLKNHATEKCMEGWWNEWVEMASCNSLAGRQWWRHLTP